MNTKHAIVSLFAAALLTAFPATAQQHKEHHRGDAKQKPAELEQKCEMMQREMQEMHAKMQERQEEMQTLVEEMNSANGDAKVDRIAEVVTKMAQHHKHMHETHTGMMQKMMAHMGEHMAQGEGADAGRMMMQCPMMQSMDRDSSPHGTQNDSPKEGSESK